MYEQAAAAFGGAIERLAYGYEADPDKRRDLIQDIHVAVWQSLRVFDGRCSLRTWVYRVAHNTAVSRAIRPGLRQPTLVGLDELAATATEADDDAQLDRKRALERLLVLVRSLRPLDREVMLLYLEDVDAASIGEIVGLSTGNVATKVHRIKQVLMSRLKEGRRDAS